MEDKLGPGIGEKMSSTSINGTYSSGITKFLHLTMMSIVVIEFSLHVYHELALYFGWNKKHVQLSALMDILCAQCYRIINHEAYSDYEASSGLSYFGKL